MASHGTSNLLRLAESILSNTTELVAKLQEQGVQEPGFVASTPTIPPELETPEFLSLRYNLSQSATDLVTLVNGPAAFLRTFVPSHNELAALHVAMEFKFFETIPLEGEISSAALAEAVQLDEDRTRRILKALAVLRIFEESREGFFKHTAISAVPAKDPLVLSAMLLQLDEMRTASTHMASCFRESPYGSTGADSPFKHAWGMETFEFYKRNPDKAARFARAMAGVSRYDLKYEDLIDGYDWASLGAGQVVDVGGGSGHVSIALAKAFPQLSFVVEDQSPDMLSQSEKLLSDDLRHRISYRQHNFFQPQPVKPANAYIVFQCIHNWPDAQATQILKALVPALEQCAQGTPLLICDVVLPRLGQKTLVEERLLRQMDMAMLVSFNAKQRTESEFRKLAKEADPRLEVVKVRTGSSMGVVEIHLFQT